MVVVALDGASQSHDGDASSMAAASAQRISRRQVDCSGRRGARQECKSGYARSRQSVQREIRRRSPGVQHEIRWRRTGGRTLYALRYSEDIATRSDASGRPPTSARIRHARNDGRDGLWGRRGGGAGSAASGTQPGEEGRRPEFVPKGVVAVNFEDGIERGGDRSGTASSPCVRPRRRERLRRRRSGLLRRELRQRDAIVVGGVAAWVEPARRGDRRCPATAVLRRGACRGPG